MDFHLCIYLQEGTHSAPHDIKDQFKAQVAQAVSSSSNSTVSGSSSHTAVTLPAAVNGEVVISQAQSTTSSSHNTSADSDTHKKVDDWFCSCFCGSWRCLLLRY